MSGGGKSGCFVSLGALTPGSAAGRRHLDIPRRVERKETDRQARVAYQPSRGAGAFCASERARSRACLLAENVAAERDGGMKRCWRCGKSDATPGGVRDGARWRASASEATCWQGDSRRAHDGRRFVTAGAQRTGLGRQCTV
ncbi:hypothetical protein BDW22DRAFT_122809 [Trametopsis cervina]|nr:hypothetical protein BDW22DRAFT_122809 [Trametopsis cervina]